MVYLLIFMIIPQLELHEKNYQQANLVTALIITAVAVSTTIAVSQQQQQKKMAAEAKKERAQQLAAQKQLELQAGEYWEELNLKQMVLQQSENRFKTLADLTLLKVKQQKEKGQQIYTTPRNSPAQQPGIIDRINQSIDKFLRGQYG